MEWNIDDMISRTAALDAVELGITYAKVINIETGEATELFKASNTELRKAIDRIKALPTAQRWIPCSEHQPTEDGEYITTVEYGEGMFVTTTDWRQDWKEWGFLSYYGAHDEPAWRRVTNVVAWMPLPEPWKEGQGGSD